MKAKERCKCASMKWSTMISTGSSCSDVIASSRGVEETHGINHANQQREKAVKDVSGFEAGGVLENMFNSAQQKKREEEDREEKGHVSESWMDALGVGKWMPGSLQLCRGQDQSKMLVARALCAVLPNLH